MNSVHVVVQSEIICMTKLIHQITIVDNFCLGFPERLRNPLHEEIGDDAAVVIAGTDDDEIG